MSRTRWTEQIARRCRHRPGSTAAAHGRDQIRPRGANQEICAMVEKSRKNWRRWTSSCFPNTRCTACRWTPTPRSCAGSTDPR